MNLACTSGSANGGHNCWSKLLSAPMPKIFEWRLTNDGLATVQNRKCINM
jgi:hypothetical protein